jgi:hypothetical protein
MSYNIYKIIINSYSHYLISIVTRIRYVHKTIGFIRFFANLGAFL